MRLTEQTCTARLALHRHCLNWILHAHVGACHHRTERVVFLAVGGQGHGCMPRCCPTLNRRTRTSRPQGRQFGALSAPHHAQHMHQAHMRPELAHEQGLGSLIMKEGTGHPASKSTHTHTRAMCAKTHNLAGLPPATCLRKQHEQKSKARTASILSGHCNNACLPAFGAVDAQQRRPAHRRRCCIHTLRRLRHQSPPATHKQNRRLCGGRGQLVVRNARTHACTAAGVAPRACQH